MTMNVKAKLTLDTAGFDTPMQKSGEVATATARAQEKAAKQAAQAQATAAKFAADQVSDQSLRVVIARKLEVTASKEMSAAHKAAESGFLSEAEAARVEAAALQRLTDAKLKAAEASRLQNAPSASQAQAVAARFAGDAVTGHSLRIVEAKRMEAAANKELIAAHAAAQSGYLSEAEGAKLEAAALQRLTAAKLRTAEASRIQAEAAHRGSLSFSKRIEGFKVGGSIGESVAPIVETLALAELANKMREAVAVSLEFGEAMQRASEKTGLEVETLSVLHYAAAVTGGDFDGMTAAVAKMDKTIGAATEGNGKAKAFLKSLGLDATDLAGRTDGAEIAFRKFAEKLSATENPIRRVELATGLLGKSGAEMIPTLIKVGENWDEFRKKASDAGVLLDSKTAAQLEATQQRLKDLQQHILGAGLAFTTGFIPAFNQMLGVISGGKSQMDAMKEWGDNMGKTFAFVAEVIYSAASAAEFLFAASEGGSLTKAGAVDIAAAKRLEAQAGQFHDIAFAKAAPTPTRPEFGVGDEASDFLERNHLGGRGKKKKPSGEGFEGIGDLTAGAKAAAAQRKADELALKQMEADHLAWQAVADRGKGDEQAYWADRIAKMVDGAGSYTAAMKRSNALMLEAMKEFNRATVAVNRENAEAIATHTKDFFAEFNKTGGSLTPEADKSNEKAQGQFARDYIQSLRARIDGERANADAIARSSIEMQVATGNMTKLDAARAIAALHAQEYNDALEKLQDREDYIRGGIREGAAPSLEQKAQLNSVQTERANLNTTHTIQVQQDQLATGGRDTSALVGASDALRDFVDATRDSATGMRNLVNTTLSGFNSEAVKALSGQKTSFGDFGAGLARSVASTTLQKGEASVLGLFGLGTGKKPTGARGDAMHVVIDNPMGMPGGGGGSIPFSSLLPGFDSSAAGSTPGGGSGAGSTVSKLFSAILPMLPGFADGGAIAPNTWAMVGERGPEPFFSGASGGTVIPNHKMNALGGGGDTYHMNIDASGSNDPAAVEAAVQRGIAKAMPQAVANSVRANRELAQRRPTTQR